MTSPYCTPIPYVSSKNIVLAIIAFLKNLQKLGDVCGIKFQPLSQNSNWPQSLLLDLPLLTVDAAVETKWVSSVNWAPKSQLCQWLLCYLEQATYCSDLLSFKQDQQQRMRDYPTAHSTEHCSILLSSLVPIQIDHSILLKTPPILHYSFVQPFFQARLKQPLFWKVFLPHNHFLLDNL